MYQIIMQELWESDVPEITMQELWGTGERDL